MSGASIANLRQEERGYLVARVAFGSCLLILTATMAYRVAYQGKSLAATLLTLLLLYGAVAWRLWWLKQYVEHLRVAKDDKDMDSLGEEI